MFSTKMARCIQAERTILTALLWTFSALIFACGSSAATKTNAPPGSDIFQGTNILRISITISEDGMQALRRTPHGMNRNGVKRPEVRATVSEGGRIYNNVAIHLKGAAGSFSPVDHRPGLTLNFDKFVKGQTFHGLEKLSLNNSVQDSSYLAEKLSRELYRKAGVPVPRADYAVVTLNGRSLGLYVLAEGFNKQFLAQYFKKTGGNLYDGGFCEDITGSMTVNSGDNPNDRSDVNRLIAAANSARQNNKLSDLREVLDVDRFVTMTAIDVLLCHWDGYALNRNNYRVYGDPESGKMVFMPHGLDQLFGQGRDGPDTSITPHMNGMVARAVVGTTEGRALYRRRVGELRTNLFNATALVARAREIEARIQPVFAETRRARHRSAVNEVCRRIVARAENMDEQLNRPIRELKFDSNGIAAVDGWSPRNAVTGAQFDIITGPENKKQLHMRGDGGSSSASWRARVVLSSGTYRFEGTVRSRGTQGNGAVGLRISGARDGRRMQADSGWTKCAYEFQVQEQVADVELICELLGSNGEAWFDAGSLRIVRVAKN